MQLQRILLEQLLKLQADFYTLEKVNVDSCFLETIKALLYEIEPNSKYNILVLELISRLNNYPNLIEARKAIDSLNKPKSNIEDNPKKIIEKSLMKTGG